MEGASTSNVRILGLAAESSAICDEDTETSCSLQGQETASAKDTSDTSDSESFNTWTFEIKGRRNYLEYDVVDVDEDKLVVPFSSTEDSEPNDLSEFQEIAQLGAVAAAAGHDLDNLDADTSSTCSTSPSSNSDVDPGLARADFNEFWKCVQCLQINNNPNYQLCVKCHTMRKNFFPERQRKKRRRKVKREQTAKRPKVDQDTQESGIDGCSGSGSGSQPSVVGEDSGVDQVDGPSPPTVTTAREVKLTAANSQESNLCSICCINERNGLFLHGKTAHSNFCCYKCAFKTWKSIGCCPLCRQKVRQVVKLL